MRRVARAADDGYEHELVPGLRASADAARLADEVAFAHARLAELADTPPGSLAEAAMASDAEEGLWWTFLTAYLSPLEGVEEPFAAIEAVHRPWGEVAGAGAGGAGGLPELVAGTVPVGPRGAHDPSRGSSTIEAYSAWAARSGSQAAALAGEASWTPQRRFERAYERLALPGLHRVARYEALVLAGRLGLADIEPGSLLLAEPASPVVTAAKRVFGIGEPVVLGRRVRDLVAALGLPVAALDLALQNWAQPPNAPRMRAGSKVGEPPQDVRAAVAGVLGV